MKKLITRTLSALVLLFAVAALSGCSKGVTVESVCEKLAEGDEVAECTEELTRELEDCPEREAALECMGEGESENEIEACFSQCFAEEGEGGE